MDFYFVNDICLKVFNVQLLYLILFFYDRIITYYHIMLCTSKHEK